jgi:effector-binding domain-containing protein
MKTKKLNKKMSSLSIKKKRKMYGGQLITSSIDLKNLHLCNKKEKIKFKESPGSEIYTSINESFELNENTLGYFMYSFKKSNDKWFKFVVFNNDNINYIYIIYGAPINKHSVSLIQGLLNVTKHTGEYEDLRKAYHQLIELKSEKGIIDDVESNELVMELNQIINRDIPCMPLISAGSGTVNDDNSICINTKSGHYKPNIENMNIAKELFEKITLQKIVISLKTDKELLIQKYGEHADNYSGICL